MANNTGVAIIGGGVGLGLILYLMNKSTEKAGFKNLRLKIGGIHLNAQDIEMSVNVLNPNSTNYQVQSFIGDMYVSGSKVAEIKMFGDYISKGNSETTIPLIAKPVISNLFKKWADMYKTGHAQVQFKGIMNVNNTPIPITLNYLN